MKIRKICILLLVFFMALLQCVGCRHQPDTVALKKMLDDNYDDFTLIASYLLDLEYDWCYIASRNGIRLFVEFEYKEIQPKEAKDAIIRIFNAGCSSITKNVEDNSISFTLWTSFQQKECGLVYQIDDEREPIVLFLMELEVTEKPSWYCYFCDYNEWRERESN